MGNPLISLQSPQPTLEGFTQWIYTFMGIPQAACPPTQEWIAFSFYTAVATVNLWLQRLPGPIYLRAVYNLAGDLLVQSCPDEPGEEYPTDNPDGLGYFAYLRKAMDINGFLAGVIESSADESTSQSMKVPDQFSELTIADLQNLKTPWGRAYLGIAQSVGTDWGIS